MQGLTSLVEAVFWYAVLAPVAAICALLVSRRRYRALPAGARRGTVLLDVAVVLSVLGVLVVTLLPVDPYHTGIGWGLQLRPLASILDVVTHSVDASVVVRIVVLNILLFVPLGFLLTLRSRRWVLAVAIAIAISIAIETLQAVLPLGRTANIADIILNTVGAAIGAGAAPAVLGVVEVGRAVGGIRAPDEGSGPGGFAASGPPSSSAGRES